MNSAFSSDKPIKQVSEDAFNRGGFAERLARTILEKELGEGYVIGLYSPWGYGKTSTLNIIEDNIRKGEDVVIVKFNPWLFTDQSTMVRGFFQALASSIDTELKTKKEKVGDILKQYGSALAPLYSLHEPAKVLGRALSNVGLEQLRDRVEEAITKTEKRIVVIIDDVDRLDYEELFLLFKLIKIGVDFKQVIYLIAFDDKVVSSALDKQYPGSPETGQSFIEKIIQVPLNLPLIDQNTLDQYTLSGVDSVLSAYSIETSDQEIFRFRGIYDDHISHAIGTPRMANRYLNSLKFILPLVGEEINTIDLLLVEAIRLLYPAEYADLRKKRNSLTGQSRHLFADEDETLKQLKAEVDELSKKKPAVKALLSSIFPHVENAYRNSGLNYIDEQELKRGKRVASVDYFDRYFTYGIPLGDVSDLAVLHATELDQAEDIASELKAIASNTSIDAVIKKLRDYENDLKNKKNLVIAIAMIGDTFPSFQDKGFADTAIESSAKLMVVLIKALSNANQKDLAIKAIGQSTSLEQLMHFVAWIKIESDPKKEDPLFEEAKLKEILASVGTRIQYEQSNGNTVFKMGPRSLGNLYNFWADGQGKEVVATHLRQYIQSYDDVCDFLTLYLSTAYGSGPTHRAELSRDAYNYLSNVVEPEYLFDIITKYNPKLSSNDKFPKFQQGTNHLGMEKETSFREMLARQFTYIHLAAHAEKKDEEAEAAS